MRLDQRLTHSQSALAGGEGLVKPARPTKEVRRDGLAVRQEILVVGGCRAGLGELLPDSHRLAVLVLRLHRLAPPIEEQAEVVVALRQVAVEVGDGGIVVGQLLPQSHRPTVLGLRLR